MNVALTDAGRRSVAAFHADVTAELAGLLDPLAAADREQLGATVARIADAAGVSLEWGPRRDC